MRHQPDDTADQSASRRRSERSDPDQSSQDPAVFGPGYGRGRDRGPDGGAPGPARSGWHGSAAGRGPVRGYPPLPGQPPPMYPPGQFAAWNQRGEGQAAGPAAGGPAGPGPGTGRGPGAADSGGPGADSGYYGRDSGAHTEPGYSVLAVSDPAADVTSTQTWQAVGDGRASGTWAAPARSGGPAAAGAGQAGRPDAGGDLDQPGPGRRLAPWSPQAAAQRAGGTDQLTRDDRPPGRHSGPHSAEQDSGASPNTGATRQSRAARPDGSSQTAGSGQPSASYGAPGRRPGPADDAGAHGTSAPGARTRLLDRGTGREPAASGTSAARTSAPRTSAPRTGGPGRKSGSRRGKHPASAKFAVIGALVIVLVAGAALYIAARAASQRPKNAAQPKPTATVAPPSPTPTPGPYGYIGSRKDDPAPLTVGQLYPKTFATAGVQFTLTRARLSKDCVDAVNGANLQGAVSSGVCSQVARATYLASKTGMMGTIGVLNLATAKQAAKAARKGGAQNFIVQLPGRKAPTSKIGHGSGLEEALAKGHYLILIWAELTSLKTPHKGAQRTGLAQFMTQLFDSTVNASLTDRMISGSPSPTP
jgi:hypothetical protein